MRQMRQMGQMGRMGRMRRMGQGTNRMDGTNEVGGDRWGGWER
ncbi:MAG TPA: hypothetical protein PLA12_04105 [Candidatus Hydrogenedens sp.]|nr:hypothetical protein [Candidatus Hydrogenedens sp.]